MNIGQAAAGIAVALVGLGLVWATPKLERIARRFAASGIHALLPRKLVIDTSNPIAVGADGSVSRTLPEGQSSGRLVSALLRRVLLWVRWASN